MRKLLSRHVKWLLVILQIVFLRIPRLVFRIYTLIASIVKIASIVLARYILTVPEENHPVELISFPIRGIIPRSPCRSIVIIFECPKDWDLCKTVIEILIERETTPSYMSEWLSRPHKQFCHYILVDK